MIRIKEGTQGRNRGLYIVSLGSNLFSNNAKAKPEYSICKTTVFILIIKINSFIFLKNY